MKIEANIGVTPVDGERIGDIPTAVDTHIDNLDPLDVVMVGLAAKAEGREDEIDEDAMEEAAAALFVSSLLNKGVAIETIEKIFDNDKPYEIHFSYSKAEGLQVAVTWLDEDEVE